ncbi:uncharacterized protein MYCFIDRAFT_169026 [Pseudocercospora fijiensis CIRAD86]|uniref:Uncharacterized protein n=1 Tax=Pseudocercospora fijiensis (strain CIRAD86) TaxID=383855 RepID=N1Q8C6_PSEFD|nr:uncharacterized protein MYCFIDRAFT_169026 [Pseudocercospora fijiensis CIRAD86]EME87162.1 hypothetical protein MYCFIDRAFT_169026 [Pseudocercospora fijiensis CIRAD86]
MRTCTYPSSRQVGSNCLLTNPIYRCVGVGELWLRLTWGLSKVVVENWKQYCLPDPRTMRLLHSNFVFTVRANHVLHTPRGSTEVRTTRCGCGHYSTVLTSVKNSEKNDDRKHDVGAAILKRRSSVSFPSPSAELLNVVQISHSCLLHGLHREESVVLVAFLLGTEAWDRSRALWFGEQVEVLPLPSGVLAELSQWLLPQQPYPDHSEECILWDESRPGSPHPAGQRKAAAQLPLHLA